MTNHEQTTISDNFSSVSNAHKPVTTWMSSIASSVITLWRQRWLAYTAAYTVSCSGANADWVSSMSACCTAVC